MAASITSTIPPRDRRPAAGARRRGVCLADVVCGLTLSGILLAAVLSTFVMMGRSGSNAASYMTMDAGSRKALGLFARDARMAAGLVWNDATSVTLLLPDATSGTRRAVTYGWDATVGSPTYRCFYRVAGDVSSTAPREILARNVATCAFDGFDRQNLATNDGGAMKRIRVALTLRSSGAAVVNATDQIAGSFVLRNQLTM